MAYHKEIARLVNYAVAQGWRVERGRRAHFRLYHPNGVDIVVMASTPSGPRSLENNKAELRRHGLEV